MRPRLIMLLLFGAVATGTGLVDAYLGSGISAACPTSLKDGDVVFIKKKDSVYAVKILRESLEPEKASYEYLKVGSNLPAKEATTTGTFPIWLILDGVSVQWSGKELGCGLIYFSANRAGLPVSYEIGVPFFRGELKDYSGTVPAKVHFESFPDHPAGTGFDN